MIIFIKRFSTILNACKAQWGNLLCFRDVEKATVTYNRTDKHNDSFETLFLDCIWSSRTFGRPHLCNFYVRNAYFLTFT